MLDCCCGALPCDFVHPVQMIRAWWLSSFVYHTSFAIFAAADTVPQRSVQCFGLSSVHRTAGAARPAVRRSSRCAEVTLPKRGMLGSGHNCCMPGCCMACWQLSAATTSAQYLTVSQITCSGGRLVSAGTTCADLPAGRARCAGKRRAKLGWLSYRWPATQHALASRS